MRNRLAQVGAIVVALLLAGTVAGQAQQKLRIVNNGGALGDASRASRGVFAERRHALRRRAPPRSDRRAGADDPAGAARGVGARLHRRVLERGAHAQKLHHHLRVLRRVVDDENSNRIGHQADS